MGTTVVVVMFLVTATMRLESAVTIDRAVDVAIVVVVLKTVAVTLMVFELAPAAKPIVSMIAKKRLRNCIFKVLEMKRGLIEVR